MQLPIKTFWLMNGNIRRVQAENDMRSLMVSSAGMGGGEALQKSLVFELGIVDTGSADVADAPAEYDTTRDEQGFRELAAMALLL